MKHLLVSFLQSSYFPVLAPNVLKAILPVFSKTLSPRSSPVAHLHKTKYNIIILYGLIFIFLDRMRKGQGFWSESYENFS